ncbi:MAG: hypothetical protein P4L40_22470 [Terracidiphilus sp.]|nr:hypothetical protein [Terracidiphilus sp.]
MSFDSIVAEIDAEIEKLQQVRALLSHAGKAMKMAERTATTKSVKVRKQRVLSPEARKRIADAQKKRWAAARAAKAAAAKKAK